jgi:phospholipase/carboxylesterase
VSRRLAGVEGPHADATLETGGAPAAAAEVALVLVHGRGGTPGGMLRLADECYRPGTALLAPGAVRSTWFPARHDAPLDVNEPALTSAVDCVAATVDAAREIGVSPTETVLVGVSQGGCVVSEFLRRRPRRYGGAFVVSAALPGDDPEAPAARTAAGAEPLAGTPIALDSSEATWFRSVMGVTIWIASRCRPDIAFATHFLSRSMCAPTTTHILAAVLLLRYLRGSLSHGLFFRLAGTSGEIERELIIYHDATFAGDPIDSSSVAAFVVLKNGATATEADLINFCKQQ